MVVDERGAVAELDWAGATVRPTFTGHRDVAVAALGSLIERLLKRRS